ncbi:histone-like DNA-binding protein HU [Candidatus Termititenax dinenymphae]|uniref:Histone-like DNA-binding protein HU n=1 Tax=Candidatus Termititenax dinenymphae TaxID=2218523 RepID=A0A388TJF5_9BACT|nr:histone-like DNA-binding protein HU [Candidatus Termititenax dinenymphae]
MANKQDLIDTIAKSTELPKSKVKDVIDTLLDSIKDSVKKGKPVQLVGFGTWKRAARKARTGRNPQTGATIKIAARKVVRFTVGKEFKDLVNK